MFEWSWRRCSDYQFGIDLLAIFLISLKEEEVELLIKKGICFRRIYSYQYQAKFYSPVLISDKSISLHFRSLVFVIYFGHLKPTWRYPQSRILVLVEKMTGRSNIVDYLKP